MNVFPMKSGETKRLTITITENGGELAEAPEEVELLIYAGTVLTREMEPGESAGEWTYDFTAADHTAIGVGGFDAEVVLYDDAGVEIGPTIGRFRIEIERSLYTIRGT